MCTAAYSLDVTLIAVAIPVERTDAVGRALESARAAKSQGADLVEWRVDSLAAEPHADRAIARLVQESPMPCIVTVRDEQEGGAFPGRDKQRLAAWSAAVSSRPACAYIDVEQSTVRARSNLGDSVREMARLASAPLAESPRVILSVHDFQGRPAGLSSRVAELWSDSACAVAKVAWTARTVRDNIEAFELLIARAKPTIALCMGEHGLMSRVLAPKFGGFMTYARSDQTGTAPGQLSVEELMDGWHFRSIDAKTRVYGVLGSPVAHSRSPEVHNRWFQSARVNARFFAIEVAPLWESFKATLGELLAFAPLDFSGASVTMPHKEHAIRFVQEAGGIVTDCARRIGAANTIIRSSDGSLTADNTDARAVVDALAASGVRAIAGKRALVLGAGGAARAAAYGLAEAGSEIVIANRTAARAERIVTDFVTGGFAPALNVSSKALDALGGEHFDIIVNCTSVGMAGGPSPEGNPLPCDVVLDERTVVLDAVYSPAQTPLLKYAHTCGAGCVEGSQMFVAQARAQFELWTGSPPPIAAESR